LVSKGAGVNTKNDEGSTPLHLACEFASAETVRFLVSKGADVNTKNDEGSTPL
jgi:ankyrin repeat protein